MPRKSPLLALVFLSLVGLASVFHAWHHYVDPACAGDGDPHGKTCAACVGMHGGATASETAVSSAPKAFTAAALSHVEADPEVSRPWRTSAPRAPPAA
jgi:hypothetical protein